MGGVQIGSIISKQKEVEQFVNFLQQHKTIIQNNDSKSKKVGWNLQGKWKLNILSLLNKQYQNKHKFRKLLKQLIQTIENIKFQCFIKPISVLNAINNYSIKQLKSKSCLYQRKQNVKSSKNVFVDVQKLYRARQNQSQQIQTDLSSSDQEVKDLKSKKSKQILSEYDQKEKIRLILSVQFNRNYHPFYYLKQSFCQYLKSKYMNNKIQYHKFDEKLKQQIYKQINKDLDFFVQFIVNSHNIYKKWILSKINLSQQKYISYMKANVMIFLFCSNDKLYTLLLSIINAINQQYFKQLFQKITQNLDHKKFMIQQKLHIQGNFINSLQLLSKIDQITSPERMIDFLENFKKQICNDIDLYHKYFQTKQNYTIDGDNLLSIVCFLICKMRPKIKNIYSQINLVVILYGQNAHVNFGISSYMLTVFMAAFQFIQKQQFRRQIQ